MSYCASNLVEKKIDFPYCTVHRHVSVPVQPAEHGELLRAAAALPPRPLPHEPRPLPHLPVRGATQPTLLQPAPPTANSSSTSTATPTAYRQHQCQNLFVGCQVNFEK
jgi:hypothetical protein